WLSMSLLLGTWLPERGSPGRVPSWLSLLGMGPVELVTPEGLFKPPGLPCSLSGALGFCSSGVCGWLGEVCWGGLGELGLVCPGPSPPPGDPPVCAAASAQATAAITA